MCGRFTNEMTWSEICAFNSILDKGPSPSNMPPRYKIALRWNRYGETDCKFAVRSLVNWRATI